ncbi:MAG: type I DNA topoisomerase [Rickettsiales bacterium]|nr:MAG: type I DNA topoisomerase [Rickettsiales bacterium]
MKLVIVESPAKAKTINKYLGSDYKVIASFGHIRDLPSKNGSVLPDEDFAIKYEISDKSAKYVEEIRKYAKKSDEVYLATDPDREGESISWHVAEFLIQEKIFKDYSKFKRIAFNEITKKAVLNAIANPRKIDEDLVNAQQARRALDYLVGFTLSPILWRKLPGCKSAGRVQSVALRIICERESEIENFKSQEFWNIELEMLNSKNEQFLARLTHIEGKKLEKFSIIAGDVAQAQVEKIKQQKFTVQSIQKKQQKRTPPPPFITSSLQQEAARKLGFSAKKTMQVAQKLYEGVDIGGETVGLITYMRTDGVTLSEDAVDNIRVIIQSKYGNDYLPSAPRVYKSKQKNAQEAHEAIRPTDIELSPESLSQKLDKDQLNLYDLVWKRTIACQMENVLVDMVGADLISDDNNFTARATGSTIVFDGFYKVYKEGKDDSVDEEDKTLPVLFESEALKTKKVNPNQHFTEAPPRYSESSLVKRLEELGIGRPSTYASIISVLQDRKYVSVDKKRFHPNDLGRLVTTFLVGFFKQYVEYDFTAELETDLDKVSEGKLNWKILLSNFWTGFDSNVQKVAKFSTSDAIAYVEQSLDFYLFGEAGTENYEKNKKCSVCASGKLNLKLGKYGSFLACSNYPDCTFKKTNYVGSHDDAVIIPLDETKELGKSDDGQTIFLKKGPYGWYVQLGEAPPKASKVKEEKIDKKTKAKKGEKKPKAEKEVKPPKPIRSTIPPNVKPEDVTLEMALKLISLPLFIGKHSDTGEDIHMGIGRFGPYLKYQSKFTSIPRAHDPFTVNLSEAEQIIANKIERDIKNPRAPRAPKVAKEKTVRAKRK